MSRTLILSALSAAMVAIGGYIYLTASQPLGISNGQPLLAANAQEAAATSETEAAPETADAVEVIEMVLGSDDAPITVIEYASMTCPHCARFHDEVYPRLIENYVDTGHVQFILREVYFDRQGLWAAMVARCGGPLRYFGIVEMIMDEQREWVQGQPAEVMENLRRIGRRAGLVDDQINACLTEERARAMLDLSEAQMEADEISGTPSFIINGEHYSNMSYAAFADILDGLLAEAAE